jgi:hypothetical protein
MNLKACLILPALLATAGCDHGSTPLSGIENTLFGTIAGQPDFDETTLKVPELYAAVNKSGQPIFPLCQLADPKYPDAAGKIPDCVYSVMDKIDTVYGDYESDVYLAANGANLLADLSVLGLSAASTVAGSKSTKTTFSAIITAVTGTKTALDTDILYKNSITNVINTMRTERSKQKAIILGRLNVMLHETDSAPAASSPSAKRTTDPTAARPIRLAAASSAETQGIGTPPPADERQPDESANADADTGADDNVKPLKYVSLAEASQDLVTYFEVGTLVSAMISLQNTTSSKATACKKTADSAKQGKRATAKDRAGCAD